MLMTIVFLIIALLTLSVIAYVIAELNSLNDTFQNIEFESRKLAEDMKNHQ